MAKKKRIFRVTDKGRMILFSAIAVFFLLDILAKFGVAPTIRSYVGLVFVPFVASMFILAELTIIKAIRKKRSYSVLESLGLSAAVVNLVMVVLILIGVGSQAFLTVVGVIEIATLIYALAEIFVKQ